MQRYHFKKIDAFVEGQSAGNPAGCVYLPEPDALSGDAMQQIARELGGFVSEVVYVYADEGFTALRYFSPEREVAFCGHCTVAVMYDLIKNDPELARNPIIRVHVQGACPSRAKRDCFHRFRFYQYSPTAVSSSALFPR